MEDAYLFDGDSVRRISEFVKAHESRKPGLSGPRFPRIPAPELTVFRVVSDLSQEAIDDGTAIHGKTITCDFASDSQPGLTDLGNGCFGPSGAACNGIISCFPCDVTVTSVNQSDSPFAPAGTVWTFSWSGVWEINDIDADNCAWTWATRYVPTNAEAAGVELVLNNAYSGAFGGVGCQEFAIRDTVRVGGSLPADYYNLYTLRESPSCNKVVFRCGGIKNGQLECDPPNQPIYELTWTCSDTAVQEGQNLLAAMLPECVFDRVRDTTLNGGRWTVDLSFFGGSPEPGSLIVARNIGGRWYAIGARNTRWRGQKAAGSGPFRLDVEGCDVRSVPFEYLNQSYGANIATGAEHVVSWQHQTRKYIATRFEECDGYPNEAMNPYRCPCAWDCGECMPLVYTNDSCPAVTTTTSCRTTALASWATPTYTAKKKPDWDSGYYATDVGTNATCNCSWQLVQYCIDDASGYRGRSWVVEGWCHDNAANTTTHYGPTVVQDWNLKCEGARYSFSLGFGGCCCDCGPPDCSCTPPSTLYVDVSHGTCSGLDANMSGVALTGSGGTWSTSSGLPADVTSVSLTCSGGSWILSIVTYSLVCNITFTSPDSGSCDPFNLEFSGEIGSLCCGGSAVPVTASVNE